MTNTLLQYPIEPSHHVKAFSTTRISPLPVTDEEIRAMGNYAAFNVTDYCGDSPERVERNKQWLAGELGISAERIVLPRQTHTDRVLTLTPSFTALPLEERKTLLQDVDALITAEEELCIGVSTADCVPILLYSTEKHVVAAIHAGWRGTVKRISQKCVRQMTEEFSCRPSEIHAIIGPSISHEAFEVGEEVVDAFRNADFPMDAILFYRPPMHRDGQTEKKAHIDLWAANSILLEESGLEFSNIQVCGTCTYYHSDTFFSARSLGINSGRIFSAIMLERNV